MAEKRFRPVSCVTDWYIEDKKTSSFAVLTPHQASDLLNELHEENKKLKQVNEMLQMDFAITERNLMEENEQLKARLNDLNGENEWLKSEIQKLYNFVKIDVDHNIEVYPKSLMEHILEILKIIGDFE